MKWFGLSLIIFCQNCISANLSIKEWINHFEEQNITIIYSSDYLTNYNADSKIDLDSSTIEQFTSRLKQHSLDLVEIDATTFVIKSRNEEKSFDYGLMIKLFDSESSLPILNFQIEYDNNKYYSKNSRLLLNPIGSDKALLTISAKGYYPKQVLAPVLKDQYNMINYSLSHAPINIDKIIVTASKIDFQNPISSQSSINRDEINQSSPLGRDPLRVTESLVGNTSNGINGKSRTRGGGENESLIVLDNYSLRNPYHFKNFNSLFSTINLSVTENIDFYSGVFPIEFGGRLSSVMNIQSTDNIEQYKNEFNFNLINSSYTYRKSTSDYKKQLQIALRTGGHLIDSDVLTPEFDDAYFKTSQEINDNWSASQHLLISRDEIGVSDFNEEGIGEIVNTGSHDQNLWFQWFFDNYQNHKLDFQIYSSRKHDSRFGLINDSRSSGMLKEDILTKYSGIKFQQKLNFHEDFSIKYGADVYTEKTNISYQSQLVRSGRLVQQLGLESITNNNYIFNNSGMAFEAFINSRYRLNDKLIFDIGVRLEHKDWIDKTINSPRVNMSYFMNDSSVIRFALGRHQQSQYIDEILLEEETPSYFEPTSADIAIIDFTRQINTNIDFRAELYFKKYSSTQPYYENLFNSYHFLPELHYDRIKIAPDDSNASGLEVTIKGHSNKLLWSIAYAYSDVDDLINKSEVPRTWDQHNAIKIQLHHPLNIWFLKNWGLDFNFNYHSGWAKTSIIEENNFITLGERNKSKFNDFYQFDLRLNKNQKTQKGWLNYSIQINNLLNTRNACCIDYQLQGNQLLSEEKSWLPISPNINITYKWK